MGAVVNDCECFCGLYLSEPMGELETYWVLMKSLTFLCLRGWRTQFFWYEIVHQGNEVEPLTALYHLSECSKITAERPFVSRGRRSFQDVHLQWQDAPSSPWTDAVGIAPHVASSYSRTSRPRCCYSCSARLLHPLTVP